jgi:hypothetical protein
MHKNLSNCSTGGTCRRSLMSQKLSAANKITPPSTHLSPLLVPTRNQLKGPGFQVGKIKRGIIWDQDKQQVSLNTCHQLYLKMYRVGNKTGWLGRVTSRIQVNPSLLMYKVSRHFPIETAQWVS